MKRKGKSDPGRKKARTKAWSQESGRPNCSRVVDGRGGGKREVAEVGGGQIVWTLGHCKEFGFYVSARRSH